MRNRLFFKKALMASLVVAVSLTACYKDPVFPNTPQLTYVTTERFIRLDQVNGANKDSVVITMKFQDGDGDLGYNTTEREAAQKTNNFNLLVKPFRQKNGKFQEYTPLESLSGYFPRLKASDVAGPMDGLFSYSIDFLHPFTIRRDTIKFEIRMKDRSGNISNAIETEPIVLKNL